MGHQGTGDGVDIVIHLPSALNRLDCKILKKKKGRKPLSSSFLLSAPISILIPIPSYFQTYSYLSRNPETQRTQWSLRYAGGYCRSIFPDAPH